MFVNLAYAMKLRETTDAYLSSQLDVTEEHFIDCKVGVMQFSRAEKLALALLLAYPSEWLFERV